MFQIIRRLPLGLFTLFALSGCDVFDETLIPPETPVTPEGTPELLVGDTLSASLPTNLSYRTGYHDPIDFNAYSDNNGRLPSCLGEQSAPGNDVFFKIEAKSGQKWHFHVATAEAQGAADSAVYVLNATLDPDQACASPTRGVNACGPGAPEHFSFIADQTQPYYIGVDEVTGTNEKLQIFAVNAECGNGYKEHSEYCDPTAENPGPVDDCENCRKVLEDGQEDGSDSFNDGPLDATVLRLPDSSDFDFTVNGQVNTGCDYDFFTFELASPREVTATLSGPCPGIDFRFWEDDEQTSPFTLDPDPEAGCAPKTQRLGSGRHWIRVVGGAGVGATQPTYSIDLVFSPG
jgi:hypothetical protein